MKRQSGFGAIAAIMILVILSVLAAALTRLGSTQQLTSAQDLLSARAWQAAKIGNEWGLFQALHQFFTVANGSGVATQFTITTTNDFLAAGVVAGIAVSGTGVGANARVTSVDSPNQITVSVANAAGGVSGVLTFGSSPAGTWQACAGSPQTLDLHVDTGFWVTVTCTVMPYTEGASTANPLRVYRITSVACNSSAGCPAAAAIATAPNYIERMREVIATD